MGTIHLNEKQQRRAGVLSRLCGGSISRADGAMLLGVGDRQMRRLMVKYEQDGLRSVIHGNVGRSPSNKLKADVVSTVLSLSGDGGKYCGFNVCHLKDKLFEDEKISIGRTTLRDALKEAGLLKEGGRIKQARRKRRERCSAEGMMLQIDGSLHDWLEGRGSRMSLVGAVDDATGKLAYANFRPTEDQAGYLMLLRSIATTYGLPEMIYHDRHTILRSPKEATLEDELAGKLPESQVQRVMRELGIEAIPAHSPQAKGRVERTWGTLQDRLTKEMRLAGVSSIDQANEFLRRFIPGYNQRFGREPVNPENAWVVLEPGIDIPYYFSTSETRTVKPDYTISWNSKTLQILPRSTDRHLVGKTVDVHVTPEGDVYLYDGKVTLDHRLLEARPKAVQTARQKPASHPSSPPDPAAAARRRAWLYGKQTKQMAAA